MRGRNSHLCPSKEISVIKNLNFSS
uniref:Uncharacterized protein n=1 Tax=Rhizophora mucronata TaxID=61149 RepID=A0A2P2MZH6_RHIMU